MSDEHQPAIKHIVVLMLENRSFDHMLGTLPGVEGVLDAEGKLRDGLVNYADPTDANSTAYRPKLGSVFFTPTNQQVHSGEYGGPSHSFTSASEQRFGSTTDPSGKISPYYGAMPETVPKNQPVGFVKSFIRELEIDFGKSGTSLAAQQARGKGDPVEEVMEVFTADQLPAIHTLAQEFCVCDHWFSDVPGPTEPNRLFTHTATSSGLTYNPWKYDTLDMPTIYERIEGAQPPRTWAMYGFDLFDSTNFGSLRRKAQAKQTFDEFCSDAKSGTLPFYTFLCPRYADAREGQASSQHAPDDVRYGDALIAEVYELLRNGPGWNETLLVITWDEHGGYYDHVLPPAVEPPDASVSPNAFMQTEASKYHDTYLTQPDYTFRFDRLGFRVPTVLVSPLIPRGTIDKTPYRHTSILRFIADLLGTEPLTQRDASATSFESVLSLKSPRADCPTSVPSPALPKVDLRKALSEPPTSKQDEWTRRYTIGLAGHPDTGEPTQREFTSKRALHDYIEERRRFDRWYYDGSWKHARFETYAGRDKRWRWRLCDGGDIIAVSSDSYETEAEARRGLERARFLSFVLGPPIRGPARRRRFGH